MRRYFLIVLSLSLMVWSAAAKAQSQTMSDYTKYPVFSTKTVTPNILITLDNSGSMNFMAYGFEDDKFQPDNFNPDTAYYGYFDPAASYTYSDIEGVFKRDASYTSGNWDGSFLNWLTMRRVDIARKVLIGGDTQGLRDGSGNTILKGEISVQTTRRFIKFYENSGSYTPYDSYHVYRVDTDGTFEVFKIEDSGNFDFSKDFSCYCGDCYGDNDWYFQDYLFDYYWDSGQGAYRYDIELKRWDNPSCSDDHYNHTTYANYVADFNVWVEKKEADEPELFLDGNVAGVLQRMEGDARFGLEHFNSDSNGGYISSYIGAQSIDDLVINIESKDCNTATPLAETLYEGVRYYRQDSPYYYSSDYTTDRGGANDPFYYQSEGNLVECGKNFVLLLTDGEPTSDTNVPSPPGPGLDDIALWAHTNDMRNDEDLPGDQLITLYTVFAFGRGSELLKDSAKNGGFIDKDGDNLPSDPEEWDRDGDGVPDTYLEAENGNELEGKIMDAIISILQQTASSTAASVLSTTGEAKGVVLQAYYKQYDEDTKDEWLGYLKALWVDPWGNLREDSNNREAMDLNDANGNGDHIIQFVLDDNNVVRVLKYLDGDEDEDGDGISDLPDGIRDYCKNPECYDGKVGCEDECDAFEESSLDDLIPIWEAGEKLNEKLPDDRDIYTWVDLDNDGIMDGGEVIDFVASNASILRPFLGVNDPAKTPAENIAEAEKIIKFIRGEYVEGYRTRSTVLGDPTHVWKLGDIVNSTPTVVGRPAERHHEYNHDWTYGEFYRLKKDRAITVYVGANDGMLHAFNAGEFKKADDSFHGGNGGCTSTPGDEIGAERWAYIPQNLLPHLKWLTDPDYTHVNYVDLKPRVTDARIFTGNTTSHPFGWATILVGGMRFGGGEITLTDDFDGDGSSEERTFRPSYFCIDITDPKNPDFLWEKKHKDLGFTTSYPGFVRVADNQSPYVQGNWYTIFGSGPTTYQGSSDQNARFYVLDLLDTVNPGKIINLDASGNVLPEFISEKPHGFMAGPNTVDYGRKEHNGVPYYDGDYSDDLILIGETYGASSPTETGNGRMLRISIRGDDDSDSFDPSSFHYKTDPVSWEMGVLTDKYDVIEGVDGSGNTLPPVTAGINAALDNLGNVWIYFGTGRFYNEQDKIDCPEQLFLGVIDEFWKYGDTDVYNGNTAVTNLTVDADVNGYEMIFVKVILNGVERWSFDRIELNGVPTGLSFDDLIYDLKDEKGWFKRLNFEYYEGDPPIYGNCSDRVLDQPRILAGMVLFTGFRPEDDICSYGGNSYLYGLYYETGTAYGGYQDGDDMLMGVRDDGKAVKAIDMGVGKASAVGLHMNNRGGGNRKGKAFIQQSSGMIRELQVPTVFSLDGGIRGWHQ